MATEFDKAFKTASASGVEALQKFLEQYIIYPLETVIRDPGKKYINSRNEVKERKIKIGYFSLDLLPGSRGLGGTKGVLSLKQAAAPFGNFLWFFKDDRIKAYWLAYEENKSKHAGLGGGDTTIMFTAAMNGCTFGYGTQTDTGHIIVSHTNWNQPSEEKKRMISEYARTYSGMSSDQMAIKREEIATVSRRYQRDKQLKMLRETLKKKGVDDEERGSLHAGPNEYKDGAYQNEYTNRDGCNFSTCVVGLQDQARKWHFLYQRYVWFGVEKQGMIQDVKSVNTPIMPIPKGQFALSQTLQASD